MTGVPPETRRLRSTRMAWRKASTSLAWRQNAAPPPRSTWYWIAEPPMGSFTQIAGRVGRGVQFLPAGLLSNGEYVSILTGAGTGGSFWRGDALTRWRPDRTADTEGILFWLRDRDRGSCRSLTRYPAGGSPEHERATWG